MKKMEVRLGRMSRTRKKRIQIVMQMPSQKRSRSMPKRARNANVRILARSIDYAVVYLWHLDQDWLDDALDSKTLNHRMAILRALLQSLQSCRKAHGSGDAHFAVRR
mmetsp:Transcript_130132/g.243424  ORF Transcript_130132/g.243424 Transcript_130132/m.243424 type:complete len:107 (-) Transcript_130132:88-408(-)